MPTATSDTTRPNSPGSSMPRTGARRDTDSNAICSNYEPGACGQPQTTSTPFYAAVPGLERHGDAEEVGAFVGSVLQHGNGATRQSRVYREGGPSSLGTLIDEDGQ